MKYLFFILISGISIQTYSQAASYTDPASAYMRILMEKSGEGSYQQIGNFKVNGTSYLYGPKLAGNIYAGNTKAENILVSYNTYNQQLEIYDNGNDKPLIKKVVEVDSFKLISSIKTEYKEDLSFISSLLLDSSTRQKFLQVVFSGPRFSLYKGYKSDLGYVSTNYVQSELRQFDLSYEYFYIDKLKPGLKKMKTSANNVKKEFNDITNIKDLVNSDEFTTNPEYELKLIFAALNSNKTK